MSQTSTDFDAEDYTSLSSLTPSGKTEPEDTDGPDADQSGSATSSAVDPVHDVTTPIPTLPRHNYRNVNRHYQKLLDEDIAATVQLAAPADRQDQSNTDGSQRAAPHSDFFVNELTSHGRRDLRVADSESELEVSARLLRLKEKAATKGKLRYVELPGAHEVNPKLERKLELIADTLLAQAWCADVEAEKIEFGDEWLVDSDVALKLEETYEEEGSTQPSHILWPKDQLGSYARLLKPSILLELSQRFFMNEPRRSQRDRMRKVPWNESPTEPTIFRSALREMDLLTVDCTRRLVAASLLQATSRLRAKDDDQLLAVVTKNDVRTAAELLGMEPWSKLWSDVARKFGLEVYSDSAKYSDGRPVNRHGVVLSYDEVETALGFAPVPLQTVQGDHTTCDDSDSSVVISCNGSESDDRGATDTRWRSSKRRRFEADTESEEDIERHDRNAGRKEQARLLKMLRGDASTPVL